MEVPLMEVIEWIEVQIEVPLMEVKKDCYLE